MIEIQEVGNLLDRVQRHAAQLVMHVVQGRQRRRLLARIARQVGQNSLAHVFTEYAHRSSSAAIMFRLPNTTTTSLIWCPTIRYGKIAKWINEGGRVRAR